MLIKLESKTARTKALAFHPKRPWLLVALHSGAVQLWDYRMGSLLDEYHEHEGPVRGCCFHPTQPLFASCGDDYTVRVYNYRTRRALFVLHGHMDYVRSVAFHSEAPWLMSASDDQTVRIWNWQNRQCICVLTGHSHYVMCAQFHPREDLVVSGSLDQTIRVWDISGLRRKGSSAPGSPTGESLGHSAYPAALSPRGQLDLFAPPDGAVKYILEGHDRGVNWVTFHPTRPLIASASDDRSVKVWRFNDIRAWELETLRGHQNNVSCVVFHPRKDLLLSNSEDKTLKIWDISSIVSASSALPASSSSYHGLQKKCQTIRREDRFWSLGAHPENNLLAHGHDNGFVVFKLEKERPAYVVSEDTVYYFHDKVLKAFSLSDALGKSQSLMTAEHRVQLPATLTHNPSEDTILLSMNGSSEYELYCLASGQVKRGNGAFGVFTARNRFAVLDEKTNTVSIMSMDNSVYRSFTPDFKVSRLLPATSGSLFLVAEDKVHWWDLQHGRAMKQFECGKVKAVTWSVDNSRFAFFSSSTVWLVDRTDDTLVTAIDDPNKVKSAVWSEQILFYTNSHHLKYVLPNGDVGVVCTLHQPSYLLKVVDDSVYMIDRQGGLQVHGIDPSEYVFKLALQKRDFGRVMQIIQNAPLVGQAIINYLRRNGYAEIALEFVKDSASRFELAIEAGRLDLALLEAESLASRECWLRLGEEAVLMGDLEVAEAAFKNGRHEDKLSFLLLVSGQFEKLRRLELANRSQMIHNSLLLGDWSCLAELLQEESPCLAALCASNADDQATLHDVMARDGKAHVLPEIASKLPPVENIMPITACWPKTTEAVHKDEDYSGQWGAAKSLIRSRDNGNHSDYGGGYEDEPHGKEEHVRPVVPPPDMAGWGEDDILLDDEGDSDKEGTGELNYGDSFEVIDNDGVGVMQQTLPGPGRPLFHVDSSSVYGCLVRGDLKECKELLSERFGITEFEPLMPTIERLIMSAKIYLNNQGYPFVVVDGQSASSPITPEYLMDVHGKALVLTTSGAFVEALKLFYQVFYSFFFTDYQSDKLKAVFEESCEYIRGISMELARRGLSTDEKSGRSLELSCFFTHSALRPEHHCLALKSAMGAAYKAQCLRLSGKLARRLIDECSEQLNDTVKAQAKKILALSDKTNQDDPIAVGYDPLQQPFTMCQATMTQLKGSTCSRCAVCRTNYSRAGLLCTICKLCHTG